ncbi:MAG: DegT/DnrJ/EryC1/StrS family aminotransferase [archaeon]|jgi:dTDP-4-amino-4,6-dideoxygalactose transaminase
MGYLNQDYRQRKAYFYRMIDEKKLEKELVTDETLVEKQKKLEQLFAKTIGTKFALLFGSGNHALQVGLSSIELNKNNNVLVQAFTCKQVPRIINEINNSNLVDIDETYNIDLKKAKNSINKKTSAIQAIYSYGKAINSSELIDFCNKNGLELIEDCAHSLGAKNGKNVGSFGRFSIFSLRKNIPVGTGGMLCTNDKELYNAALSQKETFFTQTKNKRFKREILTKSTVFFKKTFPNLSFPYLFLSKLGYGGEAINQELLDKFECALAISSIDSLPKIISETISNAKLLIKELGEEKFSFTENSKNEINVYTRVPVYFKEPKISTTEIWGQLQREGYETGLFYKSDFELTTKNAQTNFAFSKKAANHMVPIGVQGLNKEQIIALATRIKQFSK